MICKKIEIKDEIGLHLRPATKFAAIAQQFDADIRVQYNGKTVEGKSALGLLRLEAVEGGKILLCIEGDDEKEAMQELLEFMVSEMEGKKRCFE